MDTVIKVGSTESRWISRTVGLPGLPVEEEWLEPLGLLSLLVESLFVGLCLMTFVPLPFRKGGKNSPSQLSSEKRKAGRAHLVR